MTPHASNEGTPRTDAVVATLNRFSPDLGLVDVLKLHGLAVELEQDLHTTKARLEEAEKHLERVTRELAETIKDEFDDQEVGIRGWNALHESVAAARAHLTRH